MLKNVFFVNLTPAHDMLIFDIERKTPHACVHMIQIVHYFLAYCKH